MVVGEMSAIDLALRRLLLLSRIFTSSWGKPEVLRKIVECSALEFRRNVMAKRAIMEVIERANPKMILTKDQATRNGERYVEGYFLSPLSSVFPEYLPGNLGIASWRGKFARQKDGLVIHLAGTGDHTYYRREFGFANDLLKNGISSILLQNPYYGSRKPKDQFRSSLVNVTDLFIMGGALIAECNFLLKWAKQQGFGPLGLAGVSMGGHMASLAYTNSLFPVSLVPCLSWTTASTVFVRGTMSRSVSWDVLTMELMSKRFREGIAAIPNCDWLERAASIEKQFNGDSPFNAAKSLMYILMDEFTCLSNYPTPVDTTLVKSIIAENDGYIIRDGVPQIQDLWPGAAVQVLKGMGHVEAYLASHSLFRKSICEMLEKNKHMYG